MTTLATWPLFFGRFHPLVVHLPIGLLVALAVVRLWFHRSQVKGPERVLLALLGLSCVAAAALGWMLATDGGYAPDLLWRHRWMGIGVTAGAVLCTVLHWRGCFRLYTATLAATLAGVSLVGHDGGSLTHGPDYLFRYMPNPLRTAIGLEARVDPAAFEITRVADAPVYDAIVHPILDANCISCHGPGRSRGGLRLDSRAALLAGGKLEGPAILLDDPAQSPLITRLHLPPDHEQHMPPTGKPPLTPAQKQVLEWWVRVGAPAEGSVAEIDATLPTQIMLERYLGLAPPPAPPRPLAEIAADAQRLARDLGVRIEPVAQNRDELDITAQNAAADFGDDALHRLAPLAPNILSLNLGRTQITNRGLKAVAAMTSLEKLWLDATAVTDAGLLELARLGKLRYLNLYGTAVTDAGLAHLALLPNLKTLYLWQTRVTPEAAAAFAERSVDPAQLDTWQNEITRLQKRVEEAGTSIDLGLDTPLKPAADSAAPKPAAPH